MKEIKTIKDCWNELSEAKTFDDALRLTRHFPRWTGDWTLEVLEDDTVRATNGYFDRQADSYVEDKEDLDITVEKKYYVQAMNPEFYDYKVYYNEDDAEEDHLFGVGEDYGINEAEYKKLDRILCDCFCDLDQVQNDHDNGEISTDELAEETERTVRNYFEKKDGSEFTAEEYQNIYSLCQEYYYSTDRYDGLTFMAKIMTICYGEEFEVYTMHGYSQSDWMNVVYPKRLNIKFIEAVLMATGTEFMITCDKIVSAELFDESDTYCDYSTRSYNVKTIKEGAAGIIGCDVNEIEVIE